MSIVKALREEMTRFKHQWQHVETFVDRIGELKTTDEEHAVRTRLLIAAAAAFERERELRDGGLLQPLELAVAPSAFASQLAIDAKAKEPNPKAKQRLPGAVDLEAAVASLHLAVDPSDSSKLLPVRHVRLVSPISPFNVFDESSETVTPLELPSYDFGVQDELDIDLFDASSNPDSASGLFGFDARRVAALESKSTVASVNAPSAWSTLRDARAQYVDKSTSAVGKLAAFRDALIAPPASDKPSAATLRQSAISALRDLAKACSAGAPAIKKAATKLESDYINKTFSPSKLSAAADRMTTRSAAYEAAADALEKSAAYGANAFAAIDVAIVVASQPADADVYSRTGAGSPGMLDRALDDEVEARIAYPDGTLRALRTIEWSLNRRWPSIESWFAARRDRYLDPLLIDRFLETFLSSLVRLVHGQGTQAPLEAGMTLDTSRPVSLGADTLQLAKKPGGGHYDLGAIQPGHVAVLKGGRRAIAVLLGDDSKTGKRSDTSKTTELLQRIHILPLRVSLAKSRQRPGVAAQVGLPPDMPGMLTSGEIVAGHVTLTGIDLKEGTIADRPEDDGVVQEVVALWSRLCLLLGRASVQDRLNQSPPQSGPSDVPSFLPHDVKLPLSRLPSRSAADGVLQPHDKKLLIHTATLKNHGLDPDGPAKPILARPGEVLLIEGVDAKGKTWQGVVEVTSIVRTTLDHVEDDPLLPPLSPNVCCNQPGDVLVVQVLDTSFPVPLVQARLHRDFQGFGSPSLAAQAILPIALDAKTGGDSGVHRGPELRFALDLLSRWMWPQT